MQKKSQLKGAIALFVGFLGAILLLLYAFWQNSNFELKKLCIDLNNTDGKNEGESISECESSDENSGDGESSVKTKSEPSYKTQSKHYNRKGRELSILHISDLHLLPNDTKKLTFLESLTTLKPDLIINTGDNIASDQSITILKKTLAKFDDCPKVFVYGSNDYYYPLPLDIAHYFTPKHKFAQKIRAKNDLAQPLDINSLTSMFNELGWINLNNERCKIKIADLTIKLVGLNDPHVNKAIYKAQKPSNQTYDLVLGIVHSPYQQAIKHLSKYHKTDLVFAGHTHGGQIRLPFLGALITNCDLPRSLCSGLVNINGQHTYISNGIGSSPKFPLRTFNRPSASLITLKF